MSEIHREMAELAADLGAWLEAYQAGHIVGLPTDLRVESWDDAPEDVVPAWSELAVTARADAGDRAQPPSPHVAEGNQRARRSVAKVHPDKRMVGQGNASADLLIVVGTTDRSGVVVDQPLTGQAGVMLDKMLVHVLGLARSDTYMVSVVDHSWSPGPGDARQVVELEQQLADVRPKVILVLGGLALDVLAPSKEPLSTRRGRWFRHCGIATLPTFDPRHLLAHPADKRAVFNDLKVVRGRYDELGGYRR